MIVPESIIIGGGNDLVNGEYIKDYGNNDGWGTHAFKKSNGDHSLVIWFWEKKKVWSISYEEDVNTPAMLYHSASVDELPPLTGWKIFKKHLIKFVPCDIMLEFILPEKNETEEVLKPKAKKKKKKKKLTPLVFSPPSWKQESSLEDDEHSDELLQLLLSNDVGVAALIELYQQNEDTFIRTFDLILERKVIERVTSAVKLKLLAMTVIVQNFEFLDYLLSLKQFFGILEVAKALRLLDAPRRIRQLETKLNKVLSKHGLNTYEEFQELRKAKRGGGRVVRRERRTRGSGRGRNRGRGDYWKPPEDGEGKRIPVGKISKLYVAIHNLKKDMDVLEGSVSGALQRRFRRWVMTLTDIELQFMLLNFQPTNWRMFADIVHPASSDFACPYFLQCTFGKPYPEGSICALAESATMENIVDLIFTCPELSHYYSYLRTKLECQENTDPGPPMGEMPCDIMDISEAVKRNLDENKILTLNQLSAYSDQELRNFGIDYRSARDLADELRNWGLNLRKDYEARKIFNILPDRAKAIIASTAAMEDVLWRYEELTCPETDRILCERLQDDDIFDPNHPRSNYGKLMERVLTFRDQKRSFVPHLMKHAEHRLSEIILPDNGISVAVLGDKSGSMEVAIRSSCVIASLLTVAFNADLKFFDEHCIEPPCVPRTVGDTINVVDSIKAVGGTSMAAGLYHYLENKKSLDLLVLVSDEKEADKCHGLVFHQVLKRYHEEVNSDMKVFLVSFLEKNETGGIAEDLITNEMKFEQFRMDPARPDTSKFSALLGQISMHTGDTVRRIKALRKYLEFYWDIPQTCGDLIWDYQRG